MKFPFDVNKMLYICQTDAARVFFSSVNTDCLIHTHPYSLPKILIICYRIYQVKYIFDGNDCICLWLAFFTLLNCC